MPKSYTKKDIKEISADEEEDDEENTHPNINKRKTELSELVDSNRTTKNLYLTKENTFENIQHIARIETAYIYLIHGKKLLKL
jgi:hypothetical protein